MLLIVKIINGAEHSLEVLHHLKFYQHLKLNLNKNKPTNKPKVSPDLSVQDLKSLLSNRLSIPINQQRLMHKGKALSGIYPLLGFISSHCLKTFIIKTQIA